MPRSPCRWGCGAYRRTPHTPGRLLPALSLDTPESVTRRNRTDSFVVQSTCPHSVGVPRGCLAPFLVLEDQLPFRVGHLKVTGEVFVFDVADRDAVRVGLCATVLLPSDVPDQDFGELV